MNHLPEVTIVGRQNVGKSTLFNLITKTKASITHDFPGVTRDIIKYHTKRDEIEKEFLLCDSPGLDIENIDEIASSIIEVSFQQLMDSSIIIFMMDKNEITAYDHKLIELFLRDKRFNKKKFIFCLNKSDNPEEEIDYEFFYKIGLNEVIPISALGRRNIKLLLEKINLYLQDVHITSDSIEVNFRLSIVGKPNSGKSSLLNSILGYNRAVVSNIPGTTRDPVNSVFQYKDNRIEIIDTAGIRKQSKESDDKLEYLSFNRTVKAIQSSNVVVHLIDATKGIGEFDKKIFSLIRENGKPLLLAINKWDLIENKDSNTYEEYKKKLINRFFAVKEVPIISISATEKQRLTKLLDECVELYNKTSIKISTSKLNSDIRKWMGENKVHSIMKKPPKLLYATQISTSPFKIVCFVNDPDLFKSAVISYLKKKIIAEYELNGVSVELELRSDRK